ncbi:MAG: inorganic phosphate transporter [Armatimonadetes bacterium]|nr:inorganic phosphate transporter [Armatimonadota bacterium]
MISALISLSAVATVAFLNGANDISRSIAAMVGAGVRDYKRACQIGTFGTVLGALISFWFASKMVETFTKSWTVQPLQPSPLLLLGVSVVISLWLIAMTWFGIPVSTTHSIVGTLIGFSLVAQGFEEILWGKIAVKIFLPLLFSPIIALSLSFLLYCALAYLDKFNPCVCIGDISPQLSAETQGEVIAIVPASKFSFIFASVQSCQQFFQHKVGVTADHLHLLSAILIAVARALNDTPKIVALGLLAQVSISQSFLFLMATLAMGLGSLFSGWRVTRTLAKKITKLDNRTGLSANATIAFLVSLCANLGLPVSTTHVTGGAIVGAGITKGAKSVYWDMVISVFLAWCVTLPTCTLLSVIISYALLKI